MIDRQNKINLNEVSMLNKVFQQYWIAFVGMMLIGQAAAQAYTGVLDGPRQAVRFYQISGSEYGYPEVLSEPFDVLPPGTTTIMVSGATYYYQNGMFYQKNLQEQKYVVVPPPIGAVVYSIPGKYQLMMIHRTAYYMYNGVYYKRILEGYLVVPPPVPTLY
jgi:hypothetical protein